jgi:hypothetical protein
MPEAQGNQRGPTVHQPLRARALLCAALCACGSRSGIDELAPPVERARVTSEPTRPEASGCVDITRSYTSVPATVLLLIDQSQSMAFRFGDSTRWDVLRQAIVDRERGLLGSLDPNARVGLMLYTGQGGLTNPLGCPLITEVEARFSNIDAIREVYLAARPTTGGDTPTGESIDRAAAALAGVGNGGPKHILLATDGEPDTCAQPKPSQGMPQALAAATRAHAQGIDVFVLGVSQGIASQNLQQLANAGAGKEPSLVYGIDPGAEQPLTASSDPQALAEQLKGIVGDVRSCTIDLGTRVGTAQTLAGRVILDGQALANSARNGWTLTDERTLEVHGAACSKILRDGERLQVQFPCADTAPPLR